jgi:hypothetical protein
MYMRVSRCYSSGCWVQQRSIVERIAKWTGIVSVSIKRSWRNTSGNSTVNITLRVAERNVMLEHHSALSQERNWYFFPIAQQSPVGQGLLIIEASQSYSDTLHSVGFIWTGDQLDAETSTQRHTTFTGRESGSKIPRVNLSISWRWVISFTLRPALPKAPQTLKSGGFQNVH